jgi:hypothetical protein
MTQPTTKRRIGVIPPHETRYKKHLEEMRREIIPSWRIIPHTQFFLTSFAGALDCSRRGKPFDIILASRLHDSTDPGRNNVLYLTDALRNALKLDTLLLISFNSFLAKVMGLDAAAEQVHLDRLIERQMDQARPPIGGIVVTTSTDPVFLVSVLGDLLDNPATYLRRKEIHQIETQAQFLNHPPGHTQIGIRP